jgi:hypothetical protein
MLVRKEPHSCGKLIKRRSTDYEGPDSFSQLSYSKNNPEDHASFNLHSTSTQDAKTKKGLPRKVSFDAIRLSD